MSSFDPKSGEITVFIKRFGKGVEEWSGQLIETMHAVTESEIAIDDVRLHIGGPNGSLQVEPDFMNHFILTAGGIGVTPMAAILEDRIRKVVVGTCTTKTTLIWTTRALEEISAFSYLFHAVADLPEAERALFDIRVFKTGTTGDEDIEAHATLGAVKISSGRPDFGSVIGTVVLSANPKSRTGVYTFGPEAMTDA